MAEKLFYLKLGKTPSEDELVARFTVEPSEGLTVEKAANAIAAESSIGTWTEVAAMDEKFRERFRAKVTKIEGSLIEVAYPAVLFENGNMPQIFSSVAGNIFGMKDVNNLRLESLRFPREIVASFEGPAFGIVGIREKFGVNDRPLVGTIVKPKIGLDPEAQSEVLYEAMRNGCDVVKDDENLTSQDFCPFEERIRKCLDKAKKAEDETGEKKGYIPNITAPVETMMRRAELVEKLGGIFAMVDIVTVGWSGIQTVRNASLGLILHGHRAMHAAFTRSKAHGISMEVIARASRLAGIDQLHIGTAVGKMEGSREGVLRCASALREKTEGSGALKQEWGETRPAMPIASGGLHPGHIHALVEIFGRNCIFQFGGGIHGHPGGTAAGARAVRLALKAALEGVPLGKAASGSPELKAVIDKWGN